MTRIGIGSDHAGFSAKDILTSHLTSSGYSVVDCGPSNEDSVDYPDYAKILGEKVVTREVGLGILICGTGIGMSISANKIVGIRAALCTSTKMAQMSRAHNDANVLVLGSRITDLEDMKEIVNVWLNTEFEGGRHTHRVNKIEDE